MQKKKQALEHLAQEHIDDVRRFQEDQKQLNQEFDKKQKRVPITDDMRNIFIN